MRSYNCRTRYSLLWLSNGAGILWWHYSHEVWNILGFL